VAASAAGIVATAGAHYKDWISTDAMFLLDGVWVIACMFVAIWKGFSAAANAGSDDKFSF
jgi:hypothetical protein